MNIRIKDLIAGGISPTTLIREIPGVFCDPNGMGSGCLVSTPEEVGQYVGASDTLADYPSDWAVWMI
jgi:hypothetical protein